MLKWINHWALCSSLIFHQLTLSLWRLKLKNKNHSPKINMEAFESVWATQGFSFILALNLCLSPSKFQAAQPHTAGQWWIGGLMVGLCRWDSSKPLIPQSFQGNYLVAALCLLYYVLKMWFFCDVRAGYQMHILKCLRLENCNHCIVTVPTQQT